MLQDGTYVRQEDGIGTSSQENLYVSFSARKVSLREPEPVQTEKKKAETAPAGGFRGWLSRLFH